MKTIYLISEIGGPIHLATDSKKFADQQALELSEIMGTSFEVLVCNMVVRPEYNQQY